MLVKTIVIQNLMSTLYVFLILKTRMDTIPSDIKSYQTDG